MVHQGGEDISARIIEKAHSLGASLAGIADTLLLQSTLSHVTDGTIEWPDGAPSVLVLALGHDEAEPELDWWVGKGGTPGNRRLMAIAEDLGQSLPADFAIRATPLPYHVKRGGIFLKDAAVMAGLGVIGKNNLLVTPAYGPRVRFRALFLHAECTPTGPITFEPCKGCDMPCVRACPRGAFEGGSFSLRACDRQMKDDEANKIVVEKFRSDESTGECIVWCRACELACPVGR